MGTEKGLVVLDIFKNMLIQVVGSENKLISKCKTIMKLMKTCIVQRFVQRTPPKIN